MIDREQFEIAMQLIDALNNIAAGLHDIANAMRQGPEDTPEEPETYMDGTPVNKAPAPPPPSPPTDINGK